MSGQAKSFLACCGASLARSVPASSRVMGAARTEPAGLGPTVTPADASSQASGTVCARASDPGCDEYAATWPVTRRDSKAPPPCRAEGQEFQRDAALNPGPPFESRICSLCRPQAVVRRHDVRSPTVRRLRGFRRAAALPLTSGHRHAGRRADACPRYRDAHGARPHRGGSIFADHVRAALLRNFFERPCASQASFNDRTAASSACGRSGRISRSVGWPSSGSPTVSAASFQSSAVGMVAWRARTRGNHSPSAAAWLPQRRA